MIAPASVLSFAKWLTPKRIRAQAVVLAVCLWGVFAVDFSTAGLYDRAGNIKFQDFLPFYISARLIAQHRAAELYDPNTRAQELQSILGKPTHGAFVQPLWTSGRPAIYSACPSAILGCGSHLDHAQPGLVFRLHLFRLATLAEALGISRPGFHRCTRFSCTLSPLCSWTDLRTRLTMLHRRTPRSPQKSQFGSWRCFWLLDT